jgi:HPt (histidine-containing phosphotransfer) domain-containing protein
MSSKLRWGAWGAAFGACFPVAALVLRCSHGGCAAARAAFESDPLLWIILSAPLFLGAFAAVGGRFHDRLRGLSAKLEERVVERTADLLQLTQQMGLVLDGVGDALVTLALDGTLDGPPQARSQAWFGEAEGGAQLASYLAPGDEKLATSLALGLEQVRDDILPIELTIEQLPHRFERADRSYTINYRVIDRGTAPRLLLAIVQDVSAEIEREHAQAERAEQQTVVARVLADPAGFRSFRDECTALLAAAESATEEVCLRRAVHTLKGSAAVYGFVRLAEACQRVEDAWADRGHARLEGDDQAALRNAFKRALASVTPFLAPGDADLVRVPRKDVLSLLDDVRAAGPTERIASTLRRWSLEPLSPVLERLAAHARQIATRLGKSVTVEVDAGEVRTDLAAHAAFFQALVHTVRNAADHGIESSEHRQACGKPEVAAIKLSARSGADGATIRVEDDGRGIDWTRLGEKARERGLPFDTEAERQEALFADGLSTAESVTDLSGRGVGLAALRAICLAQGITLRLESSPGVGTRLEFGLPRPRLTWKPPQYDLAAAQQVCVPKERARGHGPKLLESGA